MALRAEALAGRFIERAADRMVDAFVLRAESVYATPPVAGESPADAST